MEYDFVLTGRQPILMAADNIEAAEALDSWRKDPANKNYSVKGDDRSPGWTWQTRLYMDGGKVVMPAPCIMAALRHAGAQLILKKQTTFKRMTQSGMAPTSAVCEFSFFPDAGMKQEKEVTVDWLDKIRDRPFAEQLAAVRKAGFDIDLRRVPVGSSKHIRTRPKFAYWRVSGRLLVVAEELMEGDVLQRLFNMAGRDAGLCDWRPSAPKTPGAYGQFSALVTPVK